MAAEGIVRYQATLDGIDAGDLHGFFVGWPNPPSPETHLRLLAGSDHVELAVDATAGEVIGFVTAISDGVLSAYIPMVEVKPPYQGRGIGTELMRRMLIRLRDLHMIDLICDDGVNPFYERLGMTAATGMVMRNTDRQSGSRS